MAWKPYTNTFSASLSSRLSFSGGSGGELSVPLLYSANLYGQPGNEQQPPPMLIPSRVPSLEIQSMTVTALVW